MKWQKISRLLFSISRYARTFNGLREEEEAKGVKLALLFHVCVVQEKGAGGSSWAERTRTTVFSIHDLNYSLFTLFFTTYGKNRFGMYVFFPNHFDLRILRVVGPAAAAA